MPRSRACVVAFLATTLFCAVASAQATAPGSGSGSAPPSAPAGSPPSGKAALRLEDAVRLALSNNERAKKAPLRVEAAEGQLDRARGAFFPTLTAGASEQIVAHEDKSGRIATTTGSATLSQPLINASAFPQYSQAAHQRDSEKWGALQDKRQLAFDAAKAFLQCISADRVAEAAVRHLERARANLDNAKARAEAGLASVNDVTRANLDLTSSQRDVAQSAAAAARNRLTLGFVLGTPVDGALAAPEGTTRAAEAFETKADNQVTAALGRRADVLSAHSRTEALKKSAAEPMYRLVPTLSAQAQVRVLPDPLPAERAAEETVTLNLLWTLFDAGFRYADRRSRLAQAESQALDESLLRRSVAIDIATALVTLRAARESYRFTDDAVTQAVRNTEETEILYRQGLAKALELTDANARRFDAEVAREAAMLSMEQAYLDLRLALGFGPLDEETK